MDEQPQDGGAPQEGGSSQGGDFPQRQMYQGDWKCAKCGTPITELPFEPDPDRVDQLYCRDCHRERRASRGDRFSNRGGGRF